MKNFLLKLYMLGWLALSVVFMITIWNVTFSHIFKEYHERQEAVEIVKLKETQSREATKTMFQKIILDSEERVKHYLGYRVLEEQRIKGHFHHIGFDIGPDNRSYCINCHGDMPHDEIKEIRAFLNMHAFFIGCQTCHVKLEGAAKTGVFKWYDRTTGEIVASPVGAQKPGTYKAKIIPFERVEGKLQRIDSKERIEFALEFKEKEKTLTEPQKAKARKMIHHVVSELPYICEDCHKKEGSVMPFKELGYPEERISSILGTEVVGMLKNYTKFYIPRMLHPGVTQKDNKK